MSEFFTRARIGALVVLCVCAPLAAAQTVELFAGGRAIHDLPAVQSSVMPGPVAARPDGTIYIVDWYFKRLLRLDPTNGRLYTIPLVGLPAPYDSPNYNTVDSVFFGPSGAAYVVSNSIIWTIDPATGAVTQRARLWTGTSSGTACNNFLTPGQFAVDSRGSIYYTDRNYNAICKIWFNSSLPFPNIFSDGGFSGDGGDAWSAKINGPLGIVIDSADNLYFSDKGNNRVRKITAATNIITTIAGNGQLGTGGENVVATTSPVNNPYTLALNSAGDLFIAEEGRTRVRRLIAATGRISTVAGNGQQSQTPQASGVPATSVPLGYASAVAVHPGGDLLITDSTQRLVRRVAASTGIISTIAGNGQVYFCGESSAPLEACLDRSAGIAVAGNGDVYVADSGNRRVRKIAAATGQLTTIAGRTGPSEYQGNGGPASNALFPSELGGLALDPAGNLYVAGAGGNRLHRIDKLTGIITTVAGSGVSGFAGDGGPATAAQTNNIRNVAVDAAGNVYFSDSSNHRVRKVAAGTGIITTVAGTGDRNGALGDGGPATAASLNWPWNLGFDKSGNLLILDYSHNRIRVVDKTTGIIDTFAGNGSFGQGGDGGSATSAAIAPGPFAVDPGGNVFIVNGGVRRIDAQTGIITSVTGVPNKSPEGFSINPNEMAFDAQGILYDVTNQAVLKINGLPVTIPDHTPPVVQPSVVGPLGGGGWYTGDVQLTWSVSDAESTVSTQNGCASVSVTQDTAGDAFTCTATSAGGTTSVSATIRRDASPPGLEFLAPAPAPNANGWNNTAVSLAFQADDALSGLESASAPSPLVFENEGIGMLQSVTVTDVAGNSATYQSPAISIDRTPPLITSSVSGQLGNEGWYTSNVDLDWSVNEIPASLERTSGCDPAALTQDTDGVIITCAATSAGGDAAQHVTPKRDATPPAVTFGAPTPAPDARGWFSAPVSMPFETTDALSGIASTNASSPLVIEQEGMGIRRAVAATDVAGNTGSYLTDAVNIDLTPPIVTAHITNGTPGNNGWYKSDVLLNLEVNEMPESIESLSEGCDTFGVVVDTPGETFTCTVVSAGGTTTRSVTVKLDATPPALTFGTPSPAPNTNGWNKTNVSIPFTRSDALSGLASTSTTSPLVFSTEGANLTRHVTVTDLAGNTATYTSPARNIDKTAPEAEMNTPEDNGTYGFYQDLVADFWCNDLSLISCTAPTLNGEMVNTRTAGPRTYKVVAKDAAGFTTNHTHAYFVESTFNFGGFAGAAPGSTPNLVTRGALVPIRWQLPDGRGGFVTNTASFTSATVTTVSCSGAGVAYGGGTGSGATGIGYDAATHTFTYNWLTGASWSGCRKVAIRLKDNVTREIVFRFQ